MQKTCQGRGSKIIVFPFIQYGKAKLTGSVLHKPVYFASQQRQQMIFCFEKTNWYICGSAVNFDRAGDVSADFKALKSTAVQAREIQISKKQTHFQRSTFLIFYLFVSNSLHSLEKNSRNLNSKAAIQGKGSLLSFGKFQKVA